MKKFLLRNTGTTQKGADFYKVLIIRFFLTGLIKLPPGSDIQVVWDRNWTHLNWRQSISDEWASVDGRADNIFVFGKVFCVDDVLLQNSGGILRTKLVQRNVAVDP